MAEIEVKNPHSILAALQRRPRDVSRLFLPKRAGGPEEKDDVWSQITQLAKTAKVPLDSGGSRPAPSRRGHPEGGGDGGRQGTAGFARIKEKSAVSLGEVLSKKAGPSKHGIWVALDQVQDPQNLGSIFRTCGFFGVRGIVMTSERSASLTSTVYDVSCGGVESVPFACHSSFRHILEEAKNAGLWALGTSEHAPDPVQNFNLDRDWLLVFGNEEKGMRRLSQETCDVMATLPCTGAVTSLNVGVASAIVISHFFLGK